MENRDNPTEGGFFILVCMCQVAKKHVSPKTIVKAIKTCVPTLTIKTIEKYLGGAKWVVKLINRLSQFGWVNRGIDLLVLCELYSNPTVIYH